MPTFDIDTVNVVRFILAKIIVANTNVKALDKNAWINPSYCEKAYSLRRKDLDYADININLNGDYTYLIYCISKRIARITVKEPINTPRIGRLIEITISLDYSKNKYEFYINKVSDEILNNNLILNKLETILVEEAELRLKN